MNSTEKEFEETRIRAFEEFSMDFIRRFEQKRRNKGEDEFRKMVADIHHTQIEATVITNGLYSVHLENWRQVGLGGSNSHRLV